MSSSLAPIGPGDGYLSKAQAPLPASFEEVLGGAHQAPRENPFRRYLQALNRFKWLVIALTALGMAGGVVATRFMPPKYEAQATLMFEASDQPGGPLGTEGLLSAGQWIELLRTFTILDPVVRERHLYLTAPSEYQGLFRDFSLADRFLPGSYAIEFSKDGRNWTLTHGKTNVRLAGSVGDSAGARLGFLWVPKPPRAAYGEKIAFSIVTPREASVALGDNLQTNMAGRGARFLRLGLAGEDPEETAGTLNALIDRFVAEATVLKKQKLTELVAALDTQVTKAQERLRNAEGSLEGYRVRTVTLPQEDVPVASGLQMTQNTVFTDYFSQRRDLDALRRDRRSIEDVLSRSSAGEFAVDAFNTIPSVRNAPDMSGVLRELSTLETNLRGLQARYTDEYREIRDLKERIGVLRTRTIPAYAEALVRQLRDQEQELDARLGTASRELASIPTRSINEARLRREVSSAEVLFRELESRYESARLAEVSAIPDVRVLDRAVAPTNPTKNRAWVLILLGLFGGLGLGLGLAIVIDMLDPKFRYPDQVSHGLGLVILGAIPEIRRAKGRSATPEEAAQVTEAFRAIRLNLLHSYSAGPISLTVSSPEPGDGKSLVAANLALSFAEAGYRTVLIDGDTRRGELHRVFGVDRRPGLLDHLSTTIPVSDALRTSTHPRLTVIPCGTRLVQGPELLGSARMHETMAHLKATYQVIIVDSPPLSAGVDPFMLGTLTGNILVVMRAGETDRQMAESKLQVLERLPLRLLGAVLNDVSAGRGAYRYYGYSYGYGDESEDRPVPQVPATTGSSAG